MKKEYDFSGAVRGPVLTPPPGKTRITIRIDDDILRWFRSQVHAAGGGNYQSQMNSALREFIQRQNHGLQGLPRADLVGCMWLFDRARTTGDLFIS